jgi:hypothetical protein
MSSLRKFTLAIKDTALSQRYLLENSRTIFKTSLVFTFIRVIMQTATLVNILRSYKNLNQDIMTMYILLGLIFIFQLVVVMLTWFLRETRFIEYAVPLWITLTYFYINPTEPISLSTYVIT